jgi:hypothetical protein
MPDRVYLSNIARTWPIAAQEALLAKAAPGWPNVPTYRDILLPAKRRGQSREAMTERASMLRATSRRPQDEVIYVASLAVLAWDAGDFGSCLAAAAKRQATIVALDTGRRVPPHVGADDWAEATKEFLAKRRSSEAGGGRKVGAEASKKVRMEDAQQRADSIRPDWTRNDIPTGELLLRAGKRRKIGGKSVVVPMAYATAVRYLGHRPEAQRKHRMSIATAERNRARRKSDADS